MRKDTVSLVPRLLDSGRNANMYTQEEPDIFSQYEHDIIKIGPEFLEQKGNTLCVTRPTLCSMLGVYDIGPLIATVDACSKLPAI